MERFKQWFADNLADYADDIANHGADQGYPYITYYNQTTPLFDEYGDEIWEYAVEQAEEFGSKNVIEMIGGFNRKDMFDSLDQFKCLMVWYACEELARSYEPSDELEEDDDELEEDDDELEDEED